MSRFQFSRVVPSFVLLFVLGSFSGPLPALVQPTARPALTKLKPISPKIRTGQLNLRAIPSNESSVKTKKAKCKVPAKELGTSYKKWLDQDVRWIITDDERKAFMQLSNNEERDQFIEAFWQRRNPNPDSEDNEFKDEHYRRIEYANEHFAAGKPGWMTDRGRIYIVYGPAG